MTKIIPLLEELAEDIDKDYGDVALQKRGISPSYREILVKDGYLKEEKGIEKDKKKSRYRITAKGIITIEELKNARNALHLAVVAIVIATAGIVINLPQFISNTSNLDTNTAVGGLQWIVVVIIVPLVFLWFAFKASKALK